MRGQCDLLDLVGTSHPTGGFTGGLNGGKKKCDQDTNDRDDYKKFNKRESL